ncbi:MAG: NAD-dependent epimerase/dehydratase family protein [bacterium]
MSSNPTLLVTGSNGFIGSAIVSQAASSGFNVTGLSLHDDSGKKYEAKSNHIFANVADAGALIQAIGDQKFDYVINCSGYIDHSTYSKGGDRQIDTHFAGLRNLINCVKHTDLKGFVQIGSSDEYGDARAPQHEGLRESPISPYSFAKTASGHFLQMLYHTEKFPGSVARLFLVYGPGQNQHRFLPQVINGCLNDEEFPVSEGEQVRDFCYIEDIVNALLRLVQEQKAHGELFNVASGKGIKIKEMIDKIRVSVGSGRPKFGMLPYRDGENMSLIADISKITRITGWIPTTPLDNGIESTVTWYRNLQN